MLYKDKQNRNTASAMKRPRNRQDNSKKTRVPPSGQPALAAVSFSPPPTLPRYPERALLFASEA